jgi:methionyl-tRNA formyltransferase
MRVVFMGSSAASATCLKAIVRESALEVVGVVTQPDRPAGRGKSLTPCPCAAYAATLEVPEIIKPQNVNDEAVVEKIRQWRPDVIAVVAFGQFLKSPLLEMPLFGCVNCHFSLLPKYRGASPVVSALAAGDRLTGVSVIRMGIGMDDGPILKQSFEPIYSDVTGGELMDGLAITGGVALATTLVRMGNNSLPPPVAQHEEDATYARKLKKTDGLIDWSEPALVNERRIRAYSPWPGCYTFLPQRLRRKGNSGRIVVTRSEFAKITPEERAAAPGTVLRLEKRGPVVRCLDTALLLTELKPEGGSLMDGGAFLRGRQMIPFEDAFLPE